MSNNQKNEKKIKVWDMPTRVFHWLLVIAFSASSYSAFQDKFGEFAAIHLWSGFTVLALVSWRIIWGFVGSDTSRFKSFMKSPKTAFGYSKTAFRKDTHDQVGHNPLGGYSVLLMLVLLLAQAGLGLFASDDMFFEGPLASSASEFPFNVTSVHETLGYILFGVIGLHLLVILAYWLIKKVNLIVPMITGHIHSTEKAPAIRSSLLALIIITGTAAALYYSIFQ